MSGIYIPGMEMPKGCFYCILSKHLDPDTDMCVLTRDVFDSTFRVFGHRRDNCPLVPVPPHGRLIDADALWKEIKSKDNGLQLRPKGESVMYDAGLLAGYRAAAQIASKMPTIIPADKEGEG